MSAPARKPEPAWRLIAALALAVAGCQVTPPPDRLELTPGGFAGLPGWRLEAHAAAIPVLLRSCAAEAKRPPEEPLAPGLALPRQALAAPCAAAALLPPGDDAAARVFFEAWFEPHAATNNGAADGLFTGYYEPELNGARRPSARYRVPLYRLPPELAQPVKPAGFWTRAEIDGGVLAGRRLELVWLDDPIDGFFLHVQGSGRVRLAEGGTLRVGYAGQNGLPYVSLGAELIKDGVLAREDVTMQSIRAWLAANPAAAPAMMQRNPSYVFFRELSELDATDGPLGAEGAALSPGRSLAIDRRFMPLGLPVWLDAPSCRGLLLTQDTGGAIRGPVRGDVFWGTGPAAGEIAGRMKDRGRYWIFLPRPGPAS